MKRYPAYKESGVEWLGEVPEGWEVAPIRRSAKLNPSKSEIAGRSREEEVSFLPMEAVGENGELDLSRIRPIGEVEVGYTYFCDGDMTFAKITPCFENGKRALMRDLIGGVGFGTTELTVVRPDRRRMTARFLFWLLSSPGFRLNGEAHMYGAGGQKRVPDDFVRNFPAPLPSFREQQAIAAFLDRETAKIDALIEEQRRLIALLAEKRQAAISHAVTKGLNPDAKPKPSGVDWLGDVPEGWEVVRFSRLVSIAEGQVDPKLELYANMPLIAPNHIESETGRLLELQTAEEQGAESGKYIFAQGAVIYSKIRPALAKIIVAPLAGLCSADMYPLTSRGQLDQEYLALTMLTPGFTAWAVMESDRVAMPKINREKLNELMLPVPPIMEQRAIVKSVAQELDAADALINTASSGITLLQERRAALISAAVTGKIDVRDLAPSETEPA